MPDWYYSQERPKPGAISVNSVLILIRWMFIYGSAIYPFLQTPQISSSSMLPWSNPFLSFSASEWAREWLSDSNSWTPRPQSILQTNQTSNLKHNTPNTLHWFSLPILLKFSPPMRSPCNSYGFPSFLNSFPFHRLGHAIPWFSCFPFNSFFFFFL